MKKTSKKRLSRKEKEKDHILGNEKLKQRVFEMLKSDPEKRDDDFILLADLWKQDLKGMLRGKSAAWLLHHIRSGKLTHFESIRRHRQRLQEMPLGVKGTRRNRRKQLSENVKTSLRNYKRPKKVKK